MDEQLKHLCAPIPAALHAMIRERQEASGQTLGQYMAWLIQTFYEQEGKPVMTDKRTIAFQIPDELFEQFKQYLKKHGLKQNAFLLGCIQQALDEDMQSENQ